MRIFQKYVLDKNILTWERERERGEKRRGDIFWGIYQKMVRKKEEERNSFPKIFFFDEKYFEKVYKVLIFDHSYSFL